jgi:glutamate 5-kinase
MPVAVVKLGSSIVAEESGELRLSVVARVCEEVAALHRAGVDVVVVTSGAIARGMHLLGLGARPAAIEDLQAASAIGQGRLYHTYDDLLRERGVRSAQVLLTFFDMSARTHYLNARRTLRKLLEWRIVPVINENDTTTTDDISFGDNDFLAAQVSVLVGADVLVLLTDTDGLYTADPRQVAEARLVEEVGDPAELERFEIGHAPSPLGPASRPAPASRRRRRASRASSSGSSTRSRATGPSPWTRAPPGPCAKAARACSRSAS